MKTTKLPVWQTVYRAHAYTLSNIKFLALEALPWLLLVAAIAGSTHWLTYDFRNRFFDVAGVSAWLLTDLSSIICIAIVAVVVHRLLLLDRTPEPLWERIKANYFLNYVLLAIVIWSLSMIPALAASWAIDVYFDTEGLMQDSGTYDNELPQNDNEHVPFDNSLSAWGEKIAIIFIIFASFTSVFMLATFIPLRLSLALPASAIGKSGNLLNCSWKWTKRNFIRMFLGLVIISWPVYLLILPCFLFDFCNTTQTAFWYAAYGAFTYTALAISTVFWAAFLSFSYRHLAQDQ